MIKKNSTRSTTHLELRNGVHFKVEGLGFRVEGLGLGFRFYGLEFRV